MRPTGDFQRRLRDAVKSDDTARLGPPEGIKKRLDLVRNALRERPVPTRDQDLLLIKREGAASYWFTLDRPVKIGRDVCNELQLPSVFVSRVHGELLRENEMWCLVDAGSRNKVYVNGKETPRHILRDGDIIQVGDASLIFVSRPDVEPSGSASG